VLASEALEVLALRPGATPAEIKQAYRDLVKVWHPDRFSSDARLREKAEAKLREINEAYRVLEGVPESGDEGFEGVGTAEATAGTSPQQPPPPRPQERPRTVAERDKILRQWLYGTVAVLVVAFVGYAVTENRRQMAIAPAIPTAASVPSPPPPPTPITTPEATPSANPVGPKEAQSQPFRVTRLSEAQTDQMNEACVALPVESVQRGDCLRAQAGAIKAIKGKAPDLSGLTAAERGFVESACAAARRGQGEPGYKRCTAAQLASLAAEPERPDLTKLSGADRSSVERACSATGDRDGPAAYDRCAARFMKMLAQAR